MSYTPSHLCSSRFWTRRRIGTLGLYLATVGCFSLGATAYAQPTNRTVETEMAQQRAQQTMRERADKMRAEMRARLDAPKPPQVQSRTLSHDGKMAVSVSADGKVTLWDAATGKDVRSIQAYEIPASRFSHFISSYTTASFSPDDKLLWTLGKADPKTGDKTEGKMWDATTGKLLWTLGEVEGEVKSNYPLNTFAFSPDSKLVATKVRYGPVHLWDTASGQLVRTLRVPFINMDALAFSPDGKTLAGGGYHSVSYRGEIMLWDVPSGELKQSLKQTDTNLGNDIQTIQFSPDGKTLATGGGLGERELINEGYARFNAKYGIAQLWDVKSGVLMLSVGAQVHRKLINKLTFSPDSKRIATGSYDQTVGLWDAQSGYLLGSATRYGTESEVKTTETKAGERGIDRIINENNGFTQNGMNVQDKRLADPNAVGTITTNRTQTVVTGIGVQDLRFSGDGKTLNILSDDKSVRAWDVSAASPQSDAVKNFIPGLSDVAYSSFAFSPDSRQIVTGEYRNLVRFWSARERDQTDSFTAHSGGADKVAFAPMLANTFTEAGAAPLLATASQLMKWQKTEQGGAGYKTGFEVKLWDSKSHELKQRMAVSEVELTALAVSHDGEWVAAAAGRVGPLPEGAVARNGGLGVAVGGPANPLLPNDIKQEVEGVILLWNPTTGQLARTFNIDGDIPTDLTFSPDGTMLAGEGNEAGITLWKSATGEVIRNFDQDRPPALAPGARRVTARSGVPQGKTTLLFSSDGTRIARSRKGTVKFWDVKTGALQTTIANPENTTKLDAEIIALTPDGKTLVTASPFQKLAFWDIASGQRLWQSTESPQKNRISMMQVAPNGKTLATTDGGEIRLLDISEVAKGIVK